MVASIWSLKDTYSTGHGGGAVGRAVAEIRRSNPVIGKTFNTCHLYFNKEKTKINEKEAGNGPFKKVVVVISDRRTINI